jgi:hypothetical protein
MTRTLSVAMQGEVAAGQADTIRLLELQFGGGTLRYCTGSFDVSWNSVTWSAIGGEFRFSPSPESGDVSAASAEAVLTAVEGTVAQTIAGEKFVGRLLQLYTAHLDLTTRAVVVDPLLTMKAYMSGGWEIVETAGPDGTAEGSTITATVRCTSRLAPLTEHRGIQLNLSSHMQFYPNDAFFAQIVQQLTTSVSWGKSYQRIR